MRFKSSVLFLLLLIQQSLLAEIQVSTRFYPPRIAIGEQAQYLVEIKETDSRSQPQIERLTSLPIPQTGGLNLRNGRTSSNQQTRIVNGTAEYSVTQSLIIDASPPKVGTFTIPQYVFEYKGEQLSAPAATLEVVERAADAGPTTDELVFLKAELPDTLYVGQTVSLDLKLYLSEEVRLSSLNSFDRSADGFTISELPENSDERSELYNGRRYRVLTWPLTVTPIRTGAQKLNFQFSLTAQLPGRDNRRDIFGRSPFGGSLFDDFFGRAERLNVYTDLAGIHVLPLPKPQPDSFSGAIGQFAMEVGTDADTAVQGEPIMLSVIIKGRGNFERIEGPAFTGGPDWRHYDPEEQFDSSDPRGLSGSKRFDYLFIPQRAGQLVLPETEFSYFDPDSAEYVDLSTPPIEIAVSPAQNTFVAPASTQLPRSAESDIELSRTLTAEEALLTLDYRPRKARPIGRGILSNPSFIVLNAATGLALIGTALALGKLKRNREDPTYPIRREARQSLGEDRKAYLDALAREDADAFYSAAQSAIRSAATAQTGRSMRSAEGSQLAGLLPEDAAAACTDFFAAANAHRFGGHPARNLEKAGEQVKTILKAL